MGFDEPSLTKLLEVVSKMLAELLGGVFTSYPPTFIEYSWEYVRCQFYFCYYISLTGYKPCRAFFTILSSLFMPPNLPIQMFLFVSPHPRPFLMLYAHSFFHTSHEDHFHPRSGCAAWLGYWCRCHAGCPRRS